MMPNEVIITNKPILVTGAHRSGTTWVGRMLANSREVGYISEPLNVHHRPGVFREPVTRWYTYICDNNEQIYLDPYHETLSFKYHPFLEMKSIRSIKDVGRMFRDSSWFLRGSLNDLRPLLKDPFAVFSIPWFVNRLNCRAIVTVRHPAGFVSSLKKLDWSFDFNHILEQPLLLRDHLSEFETEICAAVKEPGSIIEQGALIWRMVYRVVDKFCRRMDSLIVIRHEDLSHDPISRYQDLYNQLGLLFDKDIEEKIWRSSNPGNPKELHIRQVHSTNMDSRANIDIWKSRLNDDEINQIRVLTEDVSSLFYDENDW